MSPSEISSARRALQPLSCFMSSCVGFGGLRRPCITRMSCGQYKCQTWQRDLTKEGCEGGGSMSLALSAVNKCCVLMVQLVQPSAPLGCS